MSPNLTFELVRLLLAPSKIGRGEGLEGPGSDSECSSTPGKCRISSDGVDWGDFVNRRSVDVLSARSEVARDGAAEAIGDKMGSRDGLVALLLSRSDDLLDPLGRISGV